MDRVRRTGVTALTLLTVLGSPALAQTSPPVQAAPPPAQTAPATPPVTPPAMQAPTTANTGQSKYAINASDEIEIYVWGEERLQRTLRVLPDGSIAFPLVGQIKVEGLLPQEVEKLVSERLKGQYRGDVPNVTVSIRNPSGLQFSVMGKVRTPGAFTPGRYINVLDAISLAGGPAEFANLDNISIIRRQGGKTTTLRVKLAPVFRGGVSTGDVDRASIVPLVPGDIVIVP